MSVYGAVLDELERLGCSNTSEGQRALVMAAALDDRAGVQNLAATDKQLGLLLSEVREKFTPKTGNKLALIRGDATG